ncbi:MAG: 2-oxo acid dehydrogenase subunit E2 [Enhygromyxa sp.]
MEVLVPAIADDVQEAEILALLVRVGQHVLAAQPVLELEAGKASFELPSPATGQIEEILVGIGDDVRVGDVVLTLRTVDDSAAEATEATPPRPEDPAIMPKPIVPNGVASGSMSRVTCVRASPAARRRARELDLDLDALAAELDGRVTLEQIEARARGFALTGDAELAELAELDGFDQLDGPPLGLGREPPLADGRSAPRGALHDAIDVTSLEAARRRYRDEHERGPRLTLTSFVLKACALALRDHPRMNSCLIRQGRALAIKRYVHIAVALDGDRGLGLPVVKHVDRRPLGELSEALDTLPSPARAPIEAPDQFEAPTFSITNLRSFGGARSTPIIHPPQVGALGLCRARTEAGRTLLPVSLAYDRRVNDDAAAAAFLATIAELLRDPIAMLLRA